MFESPDNKYFREDELDYVKNMITHRAKSGVCDVNS